MTGRKRIILLIVIMAVASLAVTSVTIRWVDGRDVRLQVAIDISKIKALAQQLMVIRLGVPIILCTGFSEIINEEKARAIGIREFILKPIVMTELAKVIRRLLDEETERFSGHT